MSQQMVRNTFYQIHAEAARKQNGVLQWKEKKIVIFFIIRPR